jgi:hypothetical protein
MSVDVAGNHLFCFNPPRLANIPAGTPLDPLPGKLGGVRRRKSGAVANFAQPTDHARVPSKTNFGFRN